MEYRQLGPAGVRVSVIGLGTNRFGAKVMPQDEVNRVVAAAQDLGINHIDSADIYPAQGGRPNPGQIGEDSWQGAQGTLGQVCRRHQIRHRRWRWHQ